MLTEKEDAWHTKMNCRYKAEKQQSILLRLALQLIGERIFGRFFSLLGLGIGKISFADVSLAMYALLFGSLFLVLAVSTLIFVRQMKIYR